MQETQKILALPQLIELVGEWRAEGDKIILANGGFDLLHVGHVRYLRAAKQLGGRLVVAVNSDSSLRALKGAGRPRIPGHERAEKVRTPAHGPKTSPEPDSLH